MSQVNLMAATTASGPGADFRKATSMQTDVVMSQELDTDFILPPPRDLACASNTAVG
jgi:hypothetical protein